jgi:hypothetical protein
MNDWPHTQGTGVQEGHEWDGLAEEKMYDRGSGNPLNMP